MRPRWIRGGFQWGEEWGRSCSGRSAPRVVPFGYSGERYEVCGGSVERRDGVVDAVVCL